MKPVGTLTPVQRRPSKAYLVNELRKAVHTWRDQDCQGITDTTRRLLRFWFCQREAIETLIFKKHDIYQENRIREKFVIETKGRVDIDVKPKDDRIKRWCDDTSRLTGDSWKFIRINQEEFEKHRFKSIEELIPAIAS